LKIVIVVAWWLISSGLLYHTWNKVVRAVAKVSSVKYWQALLFVATVVAFCAPKHFIEHRGFGHGCHHCCHGGEGKGDCPYAHDGDEEENAKPDKK
jgi:hypothetical protein